jgi:serine/threonine protein kinase
MKRYDLYDKDSTVKSELVAELRTNATIGKGHPHIVQYEKAKTHTHIHTHSPVVYYETTQHFCMQISSYKCHHLTLKHISTSIYQIIETERYVFVLMELVGQSKPGMRGMDLFDFITVERQENIEEEEAKVIFVQLVQALQFLHENEVYICVCAYIKHRIFIL